MLCDDTSCPPLAASDPQCPIVTFVCVGLLDKRLPHADTHTINYIFPVTTFDWWHLLSEEVGGIGSWSLTPGVYWAIMLASSSYY